MEPSHSLIQPLLNHWDKPAQLMAAGPYLKAGQFLFSIFFDVDDFFKSVLDLLQYWFCLCFIFALAMSHVGS